MNSKKTKYAICRPFDGITLNSEVEFATDDDGNVYLFDSEESAWGFLKRFDIPEEELDIIRVVEYKQEEA